jgi:hypothetical protein
MISARRFLALALAAVALASASNPLAAQPPAPAPGAPQAEGLSTPGPTTATAAPPVAANAPDAPQAAAPDPDRRLMRQVYTTSDGTYHLDRGQGTAHVQLGGKHWLVPLRLEKYDLDHDGWRYWVYRHDRGAWPCYVWGFGMDPVSCHEYAVWTGYQFAEGAKCQWLAYRWGSRLVPEYRDPIPPVPAPPE